MSSVAITVLTVTLLFGPINGNTIVNCLKDDDCHIQCNGKSACQNATILFPPDHQCILSCHGNYACDRTFINASSSSLFELNGCSNGNLYTCSGMSIYFPSADDNGNARAFIHGSNPLNGRSQPLQFYAQNGWKDIDSSGYSGTFAYFDGTMHCTNDYRTTCAFNHADWSCQSTNSLCNHLPDSSSASSSELLHIVATKTKLKSNDILLIVVIMLVVCVCWFGCILTYYIQKAAKIKKEALDKRHLKMEHMILTPMCDDDDCHFDVAAIDIDKQMISHEGEGDILTIPSKHNPFPLNPIDRVTPHRLPFINYSSIESYHESLSDLEGDEPTDMNYSIQEERQQHLLTAHDDGTNAINSIIDNDCGSPSASNKNYGQCHLSSAMYLYNSDMAIPECSENPQAITTPHMHNPLRSPTPTLSETDCPGFSAQMLGPATPKLHASSCCSNSTSTSTQHSDMTYMTASTCCAMEDHLSPTSTIRSELSSSSDIDSSGSNNHSPKPLDLKIQIYDDGFSNKKIMETLSESMETPICSNVLSVSYSHSTQEMVEEAEEFSVDNNHSWIDRNERDMLMMDDDTSSWVSQENEDEDHMLHTESATQNTWTLHTPRTQDTCMTSTEYDSSTSSMLDELQQEVARFTPCKTEDEEESMDFGIQ